MHARPFGAVAPIAAWRHAGVDYHVLVGRRARFAGYLTLLAFGPAASYRSVVLRPEPADRTLRGLITTHDPAVRSGTAEYLLALRTSRRTEPRNSKPCMEEER